MGLRGQENRPLVPSNIKENKTGKDLFVPKSTIGEYVAAGISGAVCAIPGAGALVSVVCDVAAPAVEQGIDYLIYGHEWNSEEYFIDTVSNFACDFISGSFSVKSPKYIRDIKDGAQELGIKGTKELNKHLKRKQNKAFLTNQLISATVSVGYGVASGFVKASGQRPSTFRGLVI